MLGYIVGERVEVEMDEGMEKYPQLDALTRALATFLYQRGRGMVENAFKLRLTSLPQFLGDGLNQSVMPNALGPAA